jgi:hypothetical protein
VLLTRRILLASVAAACLVPLCARHSAAEQGGTRLVSLLQTDGDLPTRLFSGPAFPPEILVDPRDGARIAYHAAFPNDHDPFAIDTSLRLGESGFALRVTDRGLTGLLPTAETPWLPNMIPFGVAIDGSLLDPSGPWYDGGPADPENPFDRTCSGWEYEVNHPLVADLVGVPDLIRGHVQPGGLFHYHGYPAPMVAAARDWEGNAVGVMALGYSADGFPIIDHLLTATDGRRVVFVSGFVLREGPRHAVARTDPARVPDGEFDGLFVQDYVYDPETKIAQMKSAAIAGESWFGLDLSADVDIRVLDARNGVVLGSALPVLPGYPEPHYAYVLTPDWPEIPRLFAFEPDDSFKAIIPMEVTGLGPRIAAFLGADVPQGREALYDTCGARVSEMRGLEAGRRAY